MFWAIVWSQSHSLSNRCQKRERYAGGCNDIASFLSFRRFLSHAHRCKQLRTQNITQPPPFFILGSSCIQLKSFSARVTFQRTTPIEIQPDQKILYGCQSGQTEQASPKSIRILQRSNQFQFGIVRIRDQVIFHGFFQFRYFVQDVSRSLLSEHQNTVEFQSMVCLSRSI